MKTEFSKGQRVVYPMYGIAEVAAIEQRALGDKSISVYVLRTSDAGLTIMVPTTNAAAVGLRAVIAKDEVDEVLEILRSREVRRDNQPWNRRSREYNEKLKTGNIFEIAEVVRDINMLKTVKELSFGERQMLDKARTLVVRELAVANGQTDADAMAMAVEALKIA